MNKGRILFADNVERFLKVRSEFLETAGYEVVKASTLEEAERLLHDTRAHLAILDIRLVDDDDDLDISGLTLAGDPAYRPVPKIILTGFPTYQAVREALGPVIDGLPPAVNFLSKQEGPEAMIQAVESAFVQHVRINWDLQIHWDQQERLSFLHLASLLQPDLPNDILVQRADELEDLCRRLFYDYRQIRIGRLLWHDRQRFCLPVLAQSSQGATAPRIIVCGERERLHHELARMRELAPETIQGTKLASTTETMHFGAATYVLPDADMETVQSLGELFQRGKERPLKTAFNHLLKEVLVAWHQRGQMVEESRDLMSLYRQWVGLEENGLSRTEVERRVEALVQAARPLSAVEVERGDGTVTFHFPNQAPLTCPDPVATIHTLLEGYDTPVVCKISPGQLTADNVLVDAGQRTWLTDFARAGQAPQWWDFVCLEAIIRFDLSQAPDLLAWQEFEECLVVPDRLHDRLRPQDVIADLRTSIVLVEQIRRQAGSKTGSDPLPYYAGLLVWAVGAMARHDPAALYTQAERMHGAHLLLAASMLARRLGEKVSASQPGGILRLDDDDTVWIGDRRIGDLGRQELALLCCLYKQAGQLVSRQTIVESVFDEQYRAGDENLESRINTLVRRLRVRIEPNPSRPRYIFTVKGRGYRLQMEGKPDE
jgi:DNA-binding response OmpR family regulator